MSEDSGEHVTLSAEHARHLINDGACPKARSSLAGTGVDLKPAHCPWCALAYGLSGGSRTPRGAE